MRVDVGDTHVCDALPVRLLVSGTLYGRGERNEATARIVAPPACEPKLFQGTWPGRAGEMPRFSDAGEGV